MNKIIKKHSVTFMILAFAAILVFSCRRDEKFITDPSAKLAFSRDTVMFDTLFTTIGSATRTLMVYNTHNDAIKISRIQLQGGSQSPYKINIDGYENTIVYDIEIAANDSLYIFVKVRIDPTANNNPFIVEDQLTFETNGNEQIVLLEAYGQDAHYITPDSGKIYHPVSGIWKNDKPYLIYGYAAIVDSSELIIEEGCRLYFHKNSGIWVDPGSTLKINGSAGQKVSLQGDRLEEFYKDLPGQWNGIMIDNGAVDNEIHHALIRNAVLGVQCDRQGNSENPTLILTNTKFENMSAGGLSGNGTSIIAANLLFDQCGEYAIALNGGQYQFQHITIGNEVSSEKTPSLVVKNYFYSQPDDAFVTLDPTNVYFQNSIIWGKTTNELITDFSETGSFSWNFDHCLIKTTKNTADENYFSQCIINKDPLFIDVEKYDYKLDTLSPALNFGKNINIPADIDGHPRNMNNPDLGAYEMDY